jgi:transposase-like protein
MSTSRRRFGTGQKATILKRYLVDKVPISDLCDEYGIKPNQIYTWQKILFDHAETAFEQAARPARSPPRRKQSLAWRTSSSRRMKSSPS